MLIQRSHLQLQNNKSDKTDAEHGSVPVGNILLILQLYTCTCTVAIITPLESLLHLKKLGPMLEVPKTQVEIEVPIESS